MVRSAERSRSCALSIRRQALRLVDRAGRAKLAACGQHAPTRWRLRRHRRAIVVGRAGARSGHPCLPQPRRSERHQVGPAYARSSAGLRPGRHDRLTFTATERRWRHRACAPSDHHQGLVTGGLVGDAGRLDRICRRGTWAICRPDHMTSFRTCSFVPSPGKLPDQPTGTCAPACAWTMSRARPR
jgi:hypothetical protein